MPARGPRGPKRHGSYGMRDLPGPPKEPIILAQYLRIESIGSIGSIILAILEGVIPLYLGTWTKPVRENPA